MLKKFFITFIFFICIISESNANNEVYIFATVDDKIITNLDVENEASYLKILNPNLNQLSDKKIFEIAKNSLIREIIKKSEIEKVFDFNQDNPFVKNYLVDLYTKLNFSNENDFKNYIEISSNYKIDEIKQKLKIEIAWNELIYLKYSKLLKIDKNELKKKVDAMSKQTFKEYQLSEIVFKKNKEEDFDILANKVKQSISEIGFNNTANIFSISDSSKFGGKIGWIKENNLSENILIKLKDINEGQTTDIIQLGNDFLILKIEGIRSKNVSIDKENELKNMIKFETNKQLNQFSKIFYDKSIMNYSINEK